MSDPKEAPHFYLHSDDNYYWTPEAYEEFKALKKVNERLKEALSYLPKVPTTSYEKEIAKKLIEVEKQNEIMREALKVAQETIFYSLRLDEKLAEAWGDLSALNGCLVEALSAGRKK